MKTTLNYYLHKYVSLLILVLSFGIMAPPSLMADDLSSMNDFTLMGIRINGVYMYHQGEYTTNEVNLVNKALEIKVEYSFGGPYMTANLMIFTNTWQKLHSHNLHNIFGPSTSYRKSFPLSQFSKSEQKIEIYINSQIYTIYIDHDPSKENGRSRATARTHKTRDSHNVKPEDITPEDIYRDRRVASSKEKSGIDVKHMLVPSPNPAKDYTIIDIPESSSGQLFIYNAQGQQIQVPYSMKPLNSLQRIRIETKNLPTGLYHVSFTGREEAYLGTLLIN